VNYDFLDMSILPRRRMGWALYHIAERVENLSELRVYS
jgi:hypothetical protein